MKKKNLIIFIFVLICIVIVGSLWVNAYQAINSKYPSEATIVTTRNETAAIREIDVKVEDFSMKDIKTFAEESKMSKEIFANLHYDLEKNAKVALVEFDITYNGDEQISLGTILDKYIIYFQSGNWRVTYDFFFIFELEDNSSLPKTLEKGDNFKITIPYFLYEEDIRDKKLWDNVENNKYQAVVNYYPCRYIMELN